MDRNSDIEAAFKKLEYELLDQLRKEASARHHDIEFLARAYARLSERGWALLAKRLFWGLAVLSLIVSMSWIGLLFVIMVFVILR